MFYYIISLRRPCYPLLQHPGGGGGGVAWGTCWGGGEPVTEDGVLGRMLMVVVRGWNEVKVCWLPAVPDGMIPRTFCWTCITPAQINNRVIQLHLQNQQSCNSTTPAKSTIVLLNYTCKINNPVINYTCKINNPVINYTCTNQQSCLLTTPAKSN